MSACKRCGLETGGDGWHVDATECLDAALYQLSEYRGVANKSIHFDRQEAAESCVLSGRIKVRDVLAVHIALAYLFGVACGIGMAFAMRWAP